MKTFKFTNFALLLFLVTFLFSYQLKAADVADLTVSVKVEADFVEYTGTLIHTGAATDNVFSQAIDLTGLTCEGATVQFKSEAGVTNRDVNLFVQGSNYRGTNADTTFESYKTRTEWDDFSPDNGGLEQTFILDRDFYVNTAIASIGTIQYGTSGFVAAVADSDGTVISVINAEKDLALQCRYIRFQSDGTGSNPATSSTSFKLRLKKDPFMRLTKTQYQNSVYDVD